jgi:hypothetical protein
VRQVALARSLPRSAGHCGGWPNAGAPVQCSAGRIVISAVSRSMRPDAPRGSRDGSIARAYGKGFI